MRRGLVGLLSLTLLPAVLLAPPVASAEDGSNVVADCGAAVQTVATYAAEPTMTARDADGTVVDITVSGVTPSPAPGSITVTDVEPAPGVGGSASATVTIDDAVPAGTYSVQVTATNDDDPPQSGTCTLTVNVIPLLPIGAVQGVVTDGDNGLTHRSPFAPPSGNAAGPREVAVRGVIYQKTLSRSSAGASQNGFFLQNTAGTADGDPHSSDGVFVFHGGFTTLRTDDPGVFYTPTVGDEIVIRGRVNEFFFLTQFSSPFVVDVVRSGVDRSAEVPAFEIDPPDDIDDAGRYWERREGMRARVPAGSTVVGGREVFTGSMDGEVWMIRGDHPVAQREDPFARRVFRDAHPLDNNPDQTFDDGNGYRFIVGSHGVKAAAGENTALIAPARTFDTVTNSPVGGVYFSLNKYQVMVEQQLQLEHGVDPSTNAPPRPFDRAAEYSVAIYNVENLYDFRDDPNDDCDFAGNPGCRDFLGRLTVTPPFDFVPESQDAYEARLARLAEQIRVDLHSPDILLVQETEDQDICRADYDTLELECFFDGRDDVSGNPDSLTELALQIERQGGPRYIAVADRDGADTRGIISAFLLRSDRVKLLPPAADDPVLGPEPTVEYRGEPAPYNAEVSNPKALNAVRPDDVDCTTECLTDTPFVFPRAPQAGLFRVWRDRVGASVFTDLYITSNHLSSGPDGRVRQRAEQAAYNAAVADAIRAADPDARVIVGGDLNVFPRPDDPFRPGHPLFPSDQLASLYEAKLTNLYDTLVEEHPATAYSFVFQGQAQTLDHLFLSRGIHDEFVEIRGAKINADWPAETEMFGRFGASDHDPQIARFLAGPTLERLADLVRHYDADGQITGERTTQILLDRLERAARFLDRGQHDAARSQLEAFADQVRDFTPQFITPTASDALVTETRLLLEHLGLC
jgi:predicted extracellular nuclease